MAVYGCHGGRYFDGHTTSVAGRQESGSEASQLEARLVVQWSTYVSFLVLREDAEDIFVTREGRFGLSSPKLQRGCNGGLT